MKKFVPGGAAVAALFALAPLAAQPANPASPPAKPAHPRPSAFNKPQTRADVPAHVKRIFAALDLNHDGFVTRDEVAASAARFEDRMSKSAPKRAARMFDRMDSDHDGKVTLAEVEATRSARLAARGKQAKATRALPSLFRTADANKDGTVTRAEFDAAVDSGKVKPRHAHMRGNEIARLFAGAGDDKVGRLSLEEAQHAMLQRFDAADLNHDGTVTPEERTQARSLTRKHRPG